MRRLQSHDKQSYKGGPIPRIRDILSTLSGGKSFTKLDLAHAYHQVPLDEESQKLTTINTPKGLYQFTRPFGISSAPTIFQRVMETLLQGIPDVSIYIDDILVMGRTQEEHLTRGAVEVGASWTETEAAEMWFYAPFP